MIPFNIEHHAAGVYTITGYHRTERRNALGQILACPPVCEIFFAEPGLSNGVTPEILEEVIARYRASMKSGPVASKIDVVELEGPPPIKNKGGRPRKVVEETANESQESNQEAA